MKVLVLNCDNYIIYCEAGVIVHCFPVLPDRKMIMLKREMLNVVKEGGRALWLKDIRWLIHAPADTHTHTHQYFPDAVERTLAFLLLMHHFLSAAYLVLIYLLFLPLMKELHRIFLSHTFSLRSSPNSIFTSPLICKSFPTIFRLSLICIFSLAHYLSTFLLDASSAYLICVVYFHPTSLSISLFQILSPQISPDFFKCHFQGVIDSH